MRLHRALLLAVMFPAAAMAAEIKGMVKDPADDWHGVANVDIRVLNEKQQEIGTTHSDGTGLYQVKNVPAGIVVKLEFKKVGYLRDPEVLSTKTSSSPTQLDCLLTQQQGSSDYYAKLAKVLKNIDSLTSQFAVQVKGIYAALPSDSQAMVVNAGYYPNYDRKLAEPPERH